MCVLYIFITGCYDWIVGMRNGLLSKAINTSVALSGCEALSHSSKEEQILQVFENTSENIWTYEG
jgi:hypothetical protein